MNRSASSLPPIRTKRKIQGMSAILLPFLANGKVDWDSFRDHVARTQDAGLIPAVNMDTGYANLIDEPTRIRVLTETQSVTSGQEFIAGAMVTDQPDSRFNLAAYEKSVESIQQYGGVPIIFQSYGLAHSVDEKVVAAYQSIGNLCDQFYAFELGTMFAPFGKIYSLDVYRSIMEISSCRGAKHSSLRRDLEWDRILLRDQLRPDFQVLTGNDLAIDMVMYGSDYLLGLSTFAPEAFARRDAFWESGSPEFYELNDLLQYLGFFAFRNPTSAYKHSAAMFLHQRGWIKSSDTHPDSPKRPESDQEILMEIRKQLDPS